MKKVLKIGALIVVVALGIFGFKYWQDTYASTTAYAVVPTKVPEKKAAVDDNGKRIPGEYEFDYTFEFVTKDGKKETLEYALLGENPTALQPGSYVKAEISKKRINAGPNPVSKSQIPAKVLAQLK